MLQKKLFRRNMRLIRESVLVKEPNFGRYEATYKRAVRRYQTLASIEEMIESCFASDIIYVGDYHTCNQSQRSFLRILKAVVKKDKNFIIGLELLHKRHQKILTHYLGRGISEETFLKKVGLRKRWVYDLWENFKPLFDFVIHHEIPAFGIDAAPKGAYLKERDRASAKWIAELAKSYPGKKIFVFIGDLHIAPSHLPGEAQKALRKIGLNLKETILYQNSESIYWKLAKESLEDHAEVVRIDEKSFCRLHTPPVILQRSYLNWLEHEEGEIDYDDPKQSFVELVDRITEFLKLDIGTQKQRVEVYTAGDLSFLERIKESRRFSEGEIQTIKQQIVGAESYYIPKLMIVYLSNISLNHAGEEATHFIKHICSGEEKARDPFDAFYANILHEALGFFGSKIINHKRKCFHENDFLKLLQFFRRMAPPLHRQLEYETALLVYQTKMLERRGEGASDMEIFKNRMDLFFSVTHALGYMLGDRLYYALMDNWVTKSEVRHLFFDPWKGDGKPFQTYWGLLAKTKEVRIPKRM